MNVHKMFRRRPGRFQKDLCMFNFRRGSELSSYEIQLQNQVTQNDVTLQVTNSKSKNKKLHFQLLTRSRKIKSYTSSYYLEGLTFIFLLTSY